MTIAEISRRYDLTADTLRYYERIGLIPPVGRSPGGKRDYSEEDCRWIEFVRCMRSAGIPIETLIEYLALFEKGDSTNEQRKQLLVEQRRRLAERMDEMRRTLQRLDMKIANYEKAVLPRERELA